MESLLESLKDYFESTPKEVLDNDWKAVEYLNDVGPDVMEYVEPYRIVAKKVCIKDQTI